MRKGRTLLLLAVFTTAGLLVARELAGQSQHTVQAPYFEVDPYWPKPLPNHWVLGSSIGVSVDERDHEWMIHRGSATLADKEKALETKLSDECCGAAPPVLEFDANGTLVGQWGGPGAGYEWPTSNHGITIDHKGNVWIGGNGPGDSQVLKFSRAGKFLLQVGKANARLGAMKDGKPTYAGGSNDPISFGRVAKIFVDPSANEAYLADGYLNKRVAIIDADTGKLKRYWGAYGNKPDDVKMPPYNPSAPPSKQFSTVHCVIVSNDGLVYVCDRVNDRIQVFRKDGTFVKEAIIDSKTYRSGSVWDMTFSRDPEQRFIYAANGVDQKINVLQRSSLEVLTSFGDGGRQPGQFFGVHNLDTDSKGNLYTAETYTGARVQRFIFKGLGPVTKRDQGVAWPANRQ